ncbi:MAG TPA: tetratricopeptide repeat protein [Thermoanaerobaculia bacterium]|nr:tetratricopeptide repeat protein [Thermoanaerobaculia bacterium]
MRKLVTLLLFVVTAASAAAQDRFFYPKADPSAISIRKDLEYRSGLKFDLYRPANDSVVPVVIFANVGSATYTTWPFYIGWGEATAGAGLAAVVYQATQPNALADFDALVADLRTRAAELKIDPSRIVVWSASANVNVGLPVAMDRSRDYLRGAVVYYGDAEVGELRTDLPVLFVRAGLDGPVLTPRIDKLLARAIAANAPWTIENYSGGLHGFEVLNDTEITRALIHRTLSFMKLVTRPEIHRAYADASFDATLGGAFTRGDWPVAVEGYRRKVSANPADAEANLRLGVSLLRSKEFAAALTSLEKAWELGRRGPRDTAWPAAEAAAGANNLERAVHWLDVLLSTPFGPPLAEVRTLEAFAPIRTAPAFIELLAGLEEQQRAVQLLESDRAADGLKLLRDAKSGRLVRDNVLTGIGYRLLQRGRRSEAVSVFTLATERHPRSANAWDSLSEALEASGDHTAALQASRKALELLPADTALSAATRESLQRASTQRVERLSGKG